MASTNKIDFDTDSYRNWLKGWIKAKGLTQSEFVEKYKDAVSSYSVLMSILNKNRNPNLTTFLQLFSPMGLKEEELFFMVILKLENELNFHDKEEAAAREFLGRIRAKLIPSLRGDYETKIPITPTFTAFHKAYELLGEKDRDGLNQALLYKLRLHAGRLRRVKDIKEAKEAMNALQAVLK